MKRSQKIAEAVAYAWFSHHGSGRMDMPVGAVAALMLVRQADKDGPDLAAQLTALDGPQLLAVLERIWAQKWIEDPYLVEMARPLHDWILEDPPKQAVIGVRAAVAAALKAGLLDLTGVADPYLRAQEDVLSALLMELRSKGARAGLGEFHTPPDVSDTITDLLLSSPFGGGSTDDSETGDEHAHGIVASLAFGPGLPPPGTSFADPCAGSGGLLRATAQWLRQQGANPAEYIWSAGEIDAVAAGCMATNAMVWGLGPNVLVFHGDSLAVADGPSRAARKRADVLAHRDRLLGVARSAAPMFDLLRRTEALLDVCADDLAGHVELDVDDNGRVSGAGQPTGPGRIRLRDVPDPARMPPVADTPALF